MTKSISSKKRVAIITGASRGIGAAIASRLADDGLTVIINYTHGSEAEQVVQKIESAGGTSSSFKADVSDPKAVASMFEEAEKRYGGIDVLINNAGIMKLAPIANVEDAEFDQHIAVNLKGSFNCLREAARRMRDGGRIVSFSSSVVGLYQPSYGVYAATKAGVEAMTHILAKEMRGRQITVNAVAPGPTNTPLFVNGKSKELIESIAKTNPFERLGEPTDIANVVSFLVGKDGGWVNGQVIRVNGGAI